VAGSGRIIFKKMEGGPIDSHFQT